MFLRTIIAVVTNVFLIFNMVAQCSTTVTSTDGYTVTINITPSAIVAPSSCPFGYNFNVEATYDVQFSGSNIPASLYTLQGVIDCDNFSNLFFDLPNAGGTGTTTTNTNPYNTDSDCATATPSSLGCNDATITIDGPGITSQQVNCPASSLPIHLLAFRGTLLATHKVLLEWTTSSEINNDFFTIERSSDLEKWHVVDEVSGAGNSDQKIHYQAYDYNFISEATYYRLKQTDFNGEFEYFPAIAITPKSNQQKLEVDYNFHEGSYTISSTHEELSALQFFDVYGRKIEISNACSFLDSEHLKIRCNELTLDVIIVQAKSGSFKLLTHK